MKTKTKKPASRKKPAPTNTEKVQALLGKIGEEIFQRRRDLKLNLQDVHKKSGGISYVLISKIERGQATNVNISTLVAITTALSLDLSVSLAEPQ